MSRAKNKTVTKQLCYTDKSFFPFGETKGVHLGYRMQSELSIELCLDGINVPRGRLSRTDGGKNRHILNVYTLIKPT